MKISFNNKVGLNKGILVVPVFSDNLKSFPSTCSAVVKSFVEKAIKLDDFKAKLGDNIISNIDFKDLPAKLLILGLGKEKKIRAANSRIIGAKIAKLAKQVKTQEISILLPRELEGFAEELTEGLLLAQYKLGKFKTDKKADQYNLETIEMVQESLSKAFEKSVKKAEIICSSVDFVKDLVNSPSNFVDSDYLTKEAQRIAQENKYNLTILGPKDLTKMGWGGVLAVNKGSVKEPRCLVFEYKGAKNSKEKPIVLIGKGVIFDTGGYNIKPTGSMETMHQDMGGAAAVFGVFELLKKLGIKKNVIGITPVVENLISADAYRPSDIITMLSGQTVEVTNTDAEGRLILADAITYGGRLDPEYMISIATLTGAVSVALGDRYAGVFGNMPKLRTAMMKAGREVDEPVWGLPIHEDFIRKFDSKYADMRNSDTGSSRYAGASKAASFLGRFYGKNKWCHIDIGGTAFTNDPREFQTSGATAYGVRLLTRFLENL